MDIYIKPRKKANLSRLKTITVGDICEVAAEPALREHALRVKLLETNSEKRQMYLVSVIDIITAIEQAIPGHTINNVGEMDTLVLFQPNKKKVPPIWNWIKIALISLIFAVGAGTAIMSFHNDADIPKVFKAYHKMLTGEESDNPRVLQFSYAIGLAAGIVVFFNHFGGKRLTADPSPLEIEMSDYDETVTDAQTVFLDAKQKGGGFHGHNGD